MRIAESALPFEGHDGSDEHISDSYARDTCFTNRKRALEGTGKLRKDVLTLHLALLTVYTRKHPLWLQK